MFKFLLLASLIALVRSQTGPGIIDARCPPNSTPVPPLHLNDPSNCRNFFKCANGLAVPFECPEGQHWSTSADACDWPDRAHCEEGTSCPPGNPHPPAHLPHESDCTIFYKCSWGVPFPINCPPGQHFSVALDRCDHPEVANCQSNGGSSTSAPGATTTRKSSESGSKEKSSSKEK